MARYKRTDWVMAIALLVPAIGGAAALGNPGLIDNFNDMILSEYTKSVVLEQDGTNDISFASPAGVLQATKTAGDNAEQVVFLRNDFTLDVGETLRVDSAAADTTLYADFGIVVTTTVDPAEVVWTAGTADARSGILAVYGKPLFNTIGYLGRNNNATPGADLGSSAGVSVTGMANPTDADWANLYRGLWIKRNSDTNFTGGWFSATLGNVQLVSWDVTDTAFGSAVGIWADLRAAHTYGDLENLRIDEANVPGDVTGEGLVTMDDFNIIKINFFNTGQSRMQGDLTGDMIVDFADFRQWKANVPPEMGASAFASLFGPAVPEPSSIVLLLVASGWLAVARPRRWTSVRPAC